MEFITALVVDIPLPLAHLTDDIAVILRGVRVKFFTHGLHIHGFWGGPIGDFLRDAHDEGC